MDFSGLTNFVRDIREATSSREAEEKRVAEELGKIRAKFRDSTQLGAYDRKKYVCKLLFIFMLGYEIDFGHMEAVALLAGHTDSEKLIGYLAISVLLHENHPLLTLTAHTMTVDLVKGKELQKTLALTAIANIGPRDTVDSFARHVSACLMSRTASIPVRKRAILAALHLFRKNPASIDLSEVGPVVAGFIASQEFSVSTCACAFTEELLRYSNNSSVAGAAEIREHLLGAKASAITKLYDVIVDRRTPSEYVQYQVPAPWLQVKLLRILQYFPPPSDQAEADKLSLIICKVIKASEKVVAEVQHQMAFKKGTNSNRSNLFVATLVEAASLSILWDCDPAALTHCRDALGVMIGDKRDANLRSLGLLMLSRMSFCSSYNFSEHVIQYQSTVVQSLHDRDNSVRLRALDLLNAMCNPENAANIVGELQEYLKVAHPSIREDLVLLIAVLSEKFCADVAWYVEVLMMLLEEAGQFIPEDVWQRLVHIVVNTPSVQKHAATLVMRVLQDRDRLEKAAVASGNTKPGEVVTAVPVASTSSGSSSSSSMVSEVVVTVGCIILGEFGYQIALLPGASPLEQLTVLNSKWHSVSDGVKATMLHTFVKFYNLYDDATTRERIVRLLSAAKSSLDAEVQQRATEYHTLVTSCGDDVLLAALEPLPEFDVGADTLVSRLRARQHGGGGGGGAGVGGDGSGADHWSRKAEERDASHMRNSKVVKPTAGVSTGTIVAAGQKVVQGTILSAAPVAAAAAAGATPVKEDAYANIFATAPRGGSSGATSATASLSQSVINPQGAVQTALRTHIPALLASAARTGKLLVDSNFVTIEVASYESRAADVRLSLRIINGGGGGAIHGLQVAPSSVASGLILQMQPPSANSIAAAGGEPVTVHLAARAQSSAFGGVTANFPTVSVSLVLSNGGGTNWSAAVPLPITLSTFVEPYKTDDAARFQSMWEQLGKSKACVTETQLVRSVTMPQVERALATASRLYTFHPGSSSQTMLFAMGALATQPGDTTQYTAVLAVAQASPTVAGDIAVAFRSTDNAAASSVCARLHDAVAGW